MSQQEATSGGIGFDAWLMLRQRSETAFEKHRRKCLDSVVKQSPVEQQRRLNGLLFQSQVARELAESPLQSTMQASAAMWSIFDELREKLGDLKQMCTTGSISKGKTDGAVSNKKAKILPLAMRSRGSAG